VVSGLAGHHKAEVYDVVHGGFSVYGTSTLGSFFWLQNTEEEPVVGGWLQIHQPQVLPPYFAAKKNNPASTLVCLLLG
jgi:hypothetical protein